MRLVAVKIMKQKFQEKIGNIITENTDSEESTFNQILNASKKMAIAFWEANHYWEPQLGDTKARNVFNGEQKEIDEILGEFLSKYRLD